MSGITVFKTEDPEKVGTIVWTPREATQAHIQSLDPGSQEVLGEWIDQLTRRFHGTIQAAITAGGNLTPTLLESLYQALILNVEMSLATLQAPNR